MEIQPFQLALDAQSFRSMAGARVMLRHLADVHDIFADQAEVRRLAPNHPLMYDFVDLRDTLPGSALSFGLTTLYPGTLGGEFYMTRGHFHARAQDSDEVYLGVSGSGLLQLQSREGAGREMELKAGSLLYTPLAWAHRTINTGSEPLVFFSIWPSSTAYDYAEITRRGGFPRRVLQGARLVPNPDFRI